jgi:hypothetical protein
MTFAHVFAGTFGTCATYDTFLTRSASVSAQLWDSFSHPRICLRAGQGRGNFVCLWDEVFMEQVMVVMIKRD